MSQSPSSDSNQKQNISDSSFKDSQTQHSQAHNNSVQNQNSGTQFVQLIHPISNLLNERKRSSTYYFSGLLLATAGIVIAWSLEPLNLIIGGILLGIGCYLCTLGAKYEHQEAKEKVDANYASDGKLNINMSGVNNYNDCIINLEGHTIDVSQDFSEIVTEIRKVLIQLQNQKYSVEDSEVQVTNTLVAQANSNPIVRDKLFEWSWSLPNFSNDFSDVEAAKAVINAASNLYSSFQDPVSVVGGNYQKLNYLFVAKQWEEADKETKRIIFKLLGKDIYI